MNVMYDDGAFELTRAYPTDAGLDIRAMYDGIVRAHQSATFDTGVHISLPHNTMGDIRPRSGLMFNHDILTFGTVDENFNGGIRVHLMNLSDIDYNVKRGDRIAQLVVTQIVYVMLDKVSELEETDRNSNGFGSTGR